jgi:hypothetical protein
MDLAPGRMYDSSRRELATRTVRLLLGTDDLVSIAKDPAALAVSETDHRNAFDIFTFNVRGLNRLRQQHA